MIRNLHAASVIALVTALAACQPATPEATPAAADAVAPAPPAQAPVPATTHAAMPAADASDARAFAGRFVAGDTSIQLRGDGSFELSDGGTRFDGTWTAEEGGTRIRLDPNSKAESDRLFSVASVDEIHPLGAEGLPTSEAAPLLREGSN